MFIQINPSVRGGDAVVGQITLTICCCNQPDGRHIRHTEGLIFSFVVLFAPVIGILEVSSMHSVVTCLVVNLL